MFVSSFYFINIPIKKIVVYNQVLAFGGFAKLYNFMGVENLSIIAAAFKEVCIFLFNRSTC